MSQSGTQRVAIVTGAARRLGKHIALRLASELRMNVLVHYGTSAAAAENVATQVRELGLKATTVSADLSEPESAADAIFEAATQIGQPEILINSAAVFDEARLPAIGTSHFELTFRVNTLAPLLLAQRLQQSLNDTSGHVINILDWRATRPGGDYLVYTASKAALASLTKGMAQQLAPGIRVNAVAPGAMLPPPGQEDWHESRAVENIPLKQRGCPEDIEDAVIYLLKSKFITGEIHHVSGGEQL